MTEADIYKAMWVVTKNEFNVLSAWGEAEERESLTAALEGFSYKAFAHKTWVEYTSEWETKSTEEALFLRAVDKLRIIPDSDEGLTESEYRNIFAREITELMNSTIIQEILSPDLKGHKFIGDHKRDLKSYETYLQG